jgi:DNA-directed RNA polymerase specialized sigma24 family protein
VSGDQTGAAATDDLTLLLNRTQQGDRAAAVETSSRICGELHRIASREMRRERPGHTLQTTALVNQAYLRLSASGSRQIQSRGHFMALACQQMRHILVDYARAAKVVEMSYFVGYADKEVLEALGVSLATVRRHRAYVRSWLFYRMRGPAAAGSPA